MTALLANIPIVPTMGALGFTALAALRTSGLALTAIVCLEALVLRRQLGLGLGRAFLLSAAANLLSTALGAASWLAYCSSFTLMPGLIVGAAIFGGMLGEVSRRTGLAAPLGCSHSSGCLLFLGLGILSAFLGIWTIPGHSLTTRRLDFSSPAEAALALASGGLLLLIGFALTCVAEAYVLCREDVPPERVVPAAVAMNLASYAFLLVASAFFLWRIYLERGWFWHR
ncbi:MAG TPA: hypothetical protein VNO81_12390 [Candidatus Nitrosotenuis sp.]|jgi:hypothetical protein|nr:hypothetical protein [Candidatus Nitrosotenuis sp.]